jgi:uncharacterized protein (DUF1684 family)
MAAYAEFSSYSKIMVRLLAALGLLGAMSLNARDGNAEYRSQIRAWQQHRETGLRAPDGWLTLVGLFWLHSGTVTIGSGETSDFLLPKDAPSQTGQFHVNGKTVTFTSLAGDQLSVNGRPFTGTITLKHDQDDDKCDKISAGPILFYVIDRDNRMAVRVKDADSATLRKFKGTRFFPINPEFRFEAKFIDKPAKVPVPNILGKAVMEDSPGLVEFAYKGQSYQLRPIYEGKTLFFIFKDLTNKTETYQAGRMVNTPLPENGQVILDFNKAYNPPCTFTPYATCPLPLKENVLPIRIEAGEMRYEGGEPQTAAR